MFTNFASYIFNIYFIKQLILNLQSNCKHCDSKTRISLLRIISLIIVLIFSRQSLTAQIVPIDSNGLRLRNFYVSLGVVAKWQNGYEIDWETGTAKTKHVVNDRSYCTRFVAAACKRLKIYTLNPNTCPHNFGTGALCDWLQSPYSHTSGWKLVEGSDPLDIYCLGQQYANNGKVVIVIFKDLFRPPGHAGLIMPSLVTCDEVKKIGPVLIAAGGNNSDSIRLNQNFKIRIKSWPEKNILVYYNEAMPFAKYK